ncbi:glycerol-3-phosphate dehydrogenase [Yoonia sp. I 8.24]|uniref:glycerol-3-phosphate dehydrogenase n=1 Tax=Yoonia sp. I 8.24 TaxID=1537229 RepID=UPI001EE0D7AE|nr:glycerol-3-phosphate dehydrogenase [Yoonia sp. I 8.24]
MQTQQTPDEICDLFVIGGGINGCGIARDAAGRGLSVTLAEMSDLASATSSASTKLFHGGLRYLEYFEVRLVREALIERETLLRAMPHISWPMRFVLPYHKDMRFGGSTPTSKILNLAMPWLRGRRPAWLIRLGLFLYDHLGGRKILPATATVDLRSGAVGAPLNDKFSKAYEYSDCWIEDSRLVVLNARDAVARGAKIMTRTKVTQAQRVDDVWEITLQESDGSTPKTVRARMLINAAGPWVGDVIHQKIGVNSTENVRLVRGSHIVTRKLYDHDKCYFFQGTDGRIIFAIPYENDFTLIGTTDADHSDPSVQPVCTDDERDYLISFANDYFKSAISVDDVVWSYSGVRPLYDDGATSATAATRDYTLKVNDTGGAPVLNVFGGKITTYRRLAESAMDKVQDYFPDLSDKWTAGVALPGGDFEVIDFDNLVSKLANTYVFLTKPHARRLVRAYGTDANAILIGASTLDDLGRDFGAHLYEAEVNWLMANEFAYTAEDVVWRRSKLGLRLSPTQVSELDTWMQAQRAKT